MSSSCQFQLCNEIQKNLHSNEKKIDEVKLRKKIVWKSEVNQALLNDEIQIR